MCIRDRSVLLDRSQGRNIIMYSPQGGMDIEAVAEETPDQIFKETIDPALGLRDFQARRIAFNFGLSGKACLLYTSPSPRD